MADRIASGGVWQRFMQVPHRAYFAVGATSLLMLLAWWCVALPVATATTLPAVLVHGLMMPVGLFPAFMLGFLFTAGPRWLGVPPPRGHLPLALGQLSGLSLTLLGFFIGGHWPALGLLVLLLVWTRATGLWWGCIRSASAQTDRRHAYAMLAAMLAGIFALAFAVAWVLSGDTDYWLLARNLTLWVWLLPVFLTVSHRMVPFFTQSVLPQRQPWRPMALLYVWLAACAWVATAASLGLDGWASAGSALLALSAAATAWVWAGRPHWPARGMFGGNRLLAMLHLSFLWLPLAALLQSLAFAGIAVGSAGTHALGLGFFGTMLVGFVTRVSMGHSGRPLQADNTVWRIYLALHVVALLRVGFAIVGATTPWLAGLAALWLVLIAVWVARMLPIYWRPRADGMPG